MSWDPKANPTITIARLLASSPESVCNELREYGELNRTDRLGSGTNEELEKALLGRAEPLINLALAQFGSSCSVARLLYTRAKDGTADPAQDRAIRLACLSNQVWPQEIFSEDKVLDEAEIARLAVSGEGEEVYLLLTNPAQRRVVEKLFRREPPFKDVAPERFRELVACASRNPALNLDDSNEFGPDMYAYGIKKGIYNLLKTVPVEPKWAQVCKPACNIDQVRGVTGVQN
jgi:hypothetical protein